MIVLFPFNVMYPFSVFGLFFLELAFMFVHISFSNGHPEKYSDHTRLRSAMLQ